MRQDRERLQRHPARTNRARRADLRFALQSLCLTPPGRPLIDLSSDGAVILRGQSYFKVPKPEDRLFLPAESLPAFLEKGWTVES